MWLIVPASEYIEGPNMVRLILRNNIDERMPHRNRTSETPSGEALNDALNDDEKIIVRLIKENPAFKQTEMAEKTGFSRAKVQRLMKALSEKSIIKRSGGKKKGHWEVTS